MKARERIVKKRYLAEYFKKKNSSLQHASTSYKQRMLRWSVQNMPVKGRQKMTSKTQNGQESSGS